LVGDVTEVDGLDGLELTGLLMRLQLAREISNEIHINMGLLRLWLGSNLSWCGLHIQ